VHVDLAALLDDPGHPDPGPEDRGGPDTRVAEYLAQPRGDIPDDHVHLVPGRVERILGLRPLGHSQVEQFHPDPGLTDIDTDDVAMIGVDVQQHARAAAVGVL
jgi:hypothetical protein